MKYNSTERAHLRVTCLQITIIIWATRRTKRLSLRLKVRLSKSNGNACCVSICVSWRGGEAGGGWGLFSDRRHVWRVCVCVFSCWGRGGWMVITWCSAPRPAPGSPLDETTVSLWIWPLRFCVDVFRFYFQESSPPVGQGRSWNVSFACFKPT